MTAHRSFAARLAWNLVLFELLLAAGSLVAQAGGLSPHEDAGTLAFGVAGNFLWWNLLLLPTFAVYTVLLERALRGGSRYAGALSPRWRAFALTPLGFLVAYLGVAGELMNGRPVAALGALLVPLGYAVLARLPGARTALV